MKKKIALITGASGYLGKQLTKELHNAGWMTLGLDRRNILSERELTIEKIRTCTKFITDWKWNFSKFIDLYKIKNGII